MGSIATLRVHDLDVLSWRDSVDPTFLFLFTTANVIREPRGSDELDDYPEGHATILAATAGELADRLDFLGIGRSATEQAFQQNAEQKLNVTKSLLSHIEPEFLQPEIGLLTSLKLSDWVGLVARALKSPELRTTYGDANPESLGRLLDLWRDDDPRLLLRALLMALDLADDIRLDVSALIDGGWIDDNFDPQATAIGHFSYAMANGSPAVIVTEGSTDAQFLSEALAIRYPHLESFVKFFDFGDGAEGSAAAGVRTVKSFAAAGISNRVVLLLDNDSAARDALRSLRTPLPKHYDVIHYPRIELAEHYPTLGPTGLSTMDVNGLAGSVEMYLGADVLKGADGKLMPVQWRSYIEGVGAYQGELMHKRQIQQRFREKVKAARSARAIPPEQDWSGIDAVIDILKRTLAGDGPP
jgi:hypothetical protein